jgi:hypothetical protein
MLDPVCIPAGDAIACDRQGRAGRAITAEIVARAGMLHQAFGPAAKPAGRRR